MARLKWGPSRAETVAAISPTRRPIREGAMGTVWFCLVAIMIAVYVLLDGFDLGAGAIHLLAAKTEEERRQILASIGPVWDGNEVWLLAAGGTLYFAFPALYAKIGRASCREGVWPFVIDRDVDHE